MPILYLPWRQLWIQKSIFNRNIILWLFWRSWTGYCVSLLLSINSCVENKEWRTLLIWLPFQGQWYYIARTHGHWENNSAELFLGPQDPPSWEKLFTQWPWVLLLSHDFDIYFQWLMVSKLLKQGECQVLGKQTFPTPLFHTEKAAVMG